MKQPFITIATLLLCGPITAIAQESPATVSEPKPQNVQPCLYTKNIRMNAAAVAQGGRIEVTIPLEATNCEVVYRQPKKLLSPQGLVLDSPSPFVFYPGSTFKNDKRHAGREDASGSLPITRNLEYHLVIEALPTAEVGKQNLVAKVSYETLDKAGQTSPREQTLTIPINVVPMGTRVETKHQTSAKEKRETVILIALAPVLLPLMLLGGLVYFFQHGQWPSC